MLHFHLGETFFAQSVKQFKMNQLMEDWLHVWQSLYFLLVLMPTKIKYLHD